ncbi:MAG: erythromycin biosynthesis sensory transduction protein eryC1 [Rickettsiales bacterium]|nr:erythromycin biosynthesis sensory transduction protein eryC1 [Rickettsiales bacterium]OUW04488.1 MAG: erythromycin biosynthesis sensory transduction protein eryC1 [Betaproteobacteria bacterium TMED156]
MIPMVDLKAQHSKLKQEINEEINKVLESTQFINGPNVKELENEIKNIFGVKYAFSCASGTDALQLSAEALDLGPGDEIITTPFTFISTAWAISYCGATPVFVDIDPKTLNIDLNLVEKSISNKTKAIIPVHLFGQPVDMIALKKICDSKSIKIIEDCAQSFGAKIGNKLTGTFGDFGCFSFFPSKNLGAYGDGGLITTNNENLANKISMLRNHGSKERYYHDIVGYNSRLDEIQACILRVKLKHINSFNTDRRRVAKKYSSLLENSEITLPFEDGIGEHVYHQFTILHKGRENIRKRLASDGISSAIYYPVPLHKQKVYKTDHGKKSYPVTEFVSKNCLSLPIYPELEDNEIEKITNLILSELK